MPKFTYKCPKDEPAVLDFCLGMPVSQVKAALLQRNPNAGIRESQTTFDYSDGAQALRTEPFVSRIRMADETKDEAFDFYFTAPPGEGRLIRMTRSMGSASNLPAVAPFMTALSDKYGEPVFSKRGQSGTIMTATMRWDFPAGRVLCADPPQQGSGLVNSRAGAARFGNNLDIIMRDLDKWGVTEPARCARWLQAYIQTFAEDEPVRSVQIEMSDFGAEIVAGQATNAWLTETEARARAERLQNAEVPDL